VRPTKLTFNAKNFHDFNVPCSSSFRRLAFFRVLFLSFMLETLGGFGTIGVVTASSGEVFLNAVANALIFGILLPLVVSEHDLFFEALLLP